MLGLNKRYSNVKLTDINKCNGENRNNIFAFISCDTYKINWSISLDYADKYPFIINSINQTDEKFV